MSPEKITVARIYSLEGQEHLDLALDILHDEENIMGVTVFRGIAGFGEDRRVHTASLLDLSLELPLILEFYDRSEKVANAIAKLQNRLQLKHIISWQAEAHILT